MKKIAQYILLSSLSCFVLGCNEDSLDTYSGKDSVYYTWPVEGVWINGSRQYPDSLGMTFAFKPIQVTDTVFKLPVSIQGNVVDYDREISVSVENSSTAQKGVHFDFPEKITFRANVERDSIPITFFRTSDMKDKSYTLVLSLLENKDFAIEMKDRIIDESTLEEKSFTRFELTVNDVIRVPQYWYYYYLGDFSAKKLLLINEVMGIPLEFYDNQLDYQAMKYHGAFMQRYLNQKTEAGETIYEEDGSPMIMGPNVQS